jgi:uncharacterized protein (TIGR03067 family)
MMRASFAVIADSLLYQLTPTRTAGFAGTSKHFISHGGKSMNPGLLSKLLSALACVVLVTGSATGRADEKPAKAPADLQGSWKLKSIEIDGKDIDPIGGGQPRWTIRDDKISYGGEEIIRFTADPSTTPRVVDLKFRDPEGVYEGIYVVEKDVLKVCLNKKTEGVKDRPGVFSTKDQAEWVLLVFEREKTPPANATEGLTAYAGVRLRNDEEKMATVIDAPIKGSPADKAGLKKGDVVLKVGATDATDLETVVKSVRSAKPGDKLDFRIARDGKEQTVTVTVGVFPFHWAVGLG